MNTKPATGMLPPWALEWFNEKRHVYDAPETMPHRRKAFYDLFCHGADRGMRDMWKRADSQLKDAVGRNEFAEILINATDATLLEKDAPRHPSAAELAVKFQLPYKLDMTKARLRGPAPHARKLMRLLHELMVVTPRYCQAHAWIRSHSQSLLGAVEQLVRQYVDLDIPDVNHIYRAHRITLTPHSKHGWRQHRHASDVVRHKVIAAAHKLAETGQPQDTNWLIQLADALETLPDLETEHGHLPELRSNKTGWPDWLRVTQRWMSEIGYSSDFLRHHDWAALVHALYGENVSEQRIGTVLREIQ